VLCLEQLIVLLFFLAGCCPAGSQTITGILPLDVGSEIRLEGFIGFETYLISRIDVTANGRFTLSYSGEDPGMGLLVSSGEQFFLVVLSGEDIEVSDSLWGSLKPLSFSAGSKTCCLSSTHPRIRVANRPERLGRVVPGSGEAVKPCRRFLCSLGKL